MLKLKLKLINLGLLISFLCCYLEWGHDGAEFIFEMEFDIFMKAKDASRDLLHPFILIPFTGQLILIYTLFQKKVSRSLTVTGLFAQGVLVIMILLVGILASKASIIISAIPFISISVLFFKTGRSLQGAKNSEEA